jgi:hypothetical protein
MKIKAFAAVLVVLSVAVSGLCYAAWRPVHPVAVQEAEPVAAPPARPVVLETSSVLVLAPAARGAEKARPVAARAKTWGCSDWEPGKIGVGKLEARMADAPRHKTCGWR